MSEHCVFCNIAAGTAPANILYHDEQVTAFRDLHPQAPTHFLVIPNRHLRGVAEAQAGDEPLLGTLLRVAAQVATQEKLTDYRLVINNGVEAGQSVWHLHVHVLGGRRLHWPPG